MVMERWFIGFGLARRLAKPWTAGERHHPKMPRRPWWAAAIVLFTVGGCVGLLIFGTADGVDWLRAGAVGLAVFVVGIIIVERRWERRRNETSRPPGDHR